MTTAAAMARPLTTARAMYQPDLEVFERWTRLGLRYMFLGMEAIDADGLDLYRAPGPAHRIRRGPHPRRQPRPRPAR
jgi:hypothetical protein